MNGAWAYVNLALYVLSFICYARYLYGNNQWVGRLATVFLAAGVLAHYVALLERSRWMHTVPYDDLYGSMSLFAWLLGVTYLGLEVYHGQRSVGAFVTLLLIIWTALVMAFAPAAAPAAPRRPRPALRAARHAQHASLRGLRPLLCAKRDLPNSESRLKSAPTRPDVLAISRTRRSRRHEPQQRARRASSASGRHVFRIRLAASPERPLLRRGPKDHRDSRDFRALCSLLLAAVKAGWRGARAARICALNFILVLFSYTIVNLYLTSFHRYL